MVKNLFKTITSTLFPMVCVGCGDEGGWVCRMCHFEVSVSGCWACPVCHAPSVSGRACSSGCASRSALSLHAAMTPYKTDAILPRVIQSLKYQYTHSMSETLEPYIRRFVYEHPDIFVDVDMIVPVPLHSRRNAERGFNQAQIIAQIIANVLDVPVVFLLKRQRYTTPQVGLPREKRLQNMKHAFVCSSGIVVPHKTMLLVDDVFTTGTTMQECARVLKDAGAKEVKGFSIARG